MESRRETLICWLKMLSEEAKRRSQAEGGLNIFSEGKKWWHLERSTHRRGRHPERVWGRLSREVVVLTAVEWCDSHSWEDGRKGGESQELLRKFCCAVWSVTVSSLSPLITTAYISHQSFGNWKCVCVCVRERERERVCMYVWTAKIGPEEAGL